MITVLIRSRPATLLKKRLWILQNFYEYLFFTKHLLATASVHFTIFKIFYSSYFTSVCFFKQDSYCYSYLILVV